MVTTRRQIVTGTARRVSSGTNSRATVTVHDTGNSGKGANAAAHGNLQSRGNSRDASWHYTVDDREAVQSYEHTARCWHAGATAGNNTSIAVEICINSDGDYGKALVNAAELVADILRAEALPITAVVQHNRWSGKNCPALIRRGQNGVTWTRFLDLVEAALYGTPTPPATVTPATPEVSGAKPTTSTGAPYAALLIDGVRGPVTIRAWQHLMTAIGRYTGLIDGQQGRLTTRALQQWLTGLGWYAGLVDGDWGPVSVRALQGFLRSKGLYTGLIDGQQGPLTVRAEQGYLNDQRQTWS